MKAPSPILQRKKRVGDFGIKPPVQSMQRRGPLVDRAKDIQLNRDTKSGGLLVGLQGFKDQGQSERSRVR